ncbi:MAG: type II toxin-antitoxin system HicA family toxin [Clostridiales bacterium]|jgi:predicted RNA binding protein YcfA (HicA-like mRNA interferase family)|nr:type II toxin-antitoxin system HicA family toxin [Clostridiales bacterium]
MKTSEFIRQLKKQGIRLEKHGTNHDWYLNPKNGKRSQIARHHSKEIPGGTRERILKDLGLK